MKCVFRYLVLLLFFMGASFAVEKEMAQEKLRYEDISVKDWEVHRRYYFSDCECRVMHSPAYDMRSGRVVLFFGGRGSTCLKTNIDAADAEGFRRKLLSRGYMLVVPFCGGNSWGSKEATDLASKVLGHLADEAGIAIPQKMPVFGSSMGGLAALMFAVRHPERVLRIADIYGAVDVAGMATRRKVYSDFINALYPDETAKKDATPLSHGKALASFPVKIYHGDKDATVPLSYSRRMEACLKENGGDVQLVVVPGIGHSNGIFKIIGEDLIEFLTSPGSVK